MLTYLQAIAQLIKEGNLNGEHLKRVLQMHNIKKVEDIKEDLLGLLTDHVQGILEDHQITPDEKIYFESIKRHFRIKEGDFVKYRLSEIENILHLQFEQIYKDNNISPEEAIHKVDLQEIFDLSYDQMDAFKIKEIQRALSEGANISQLDTALKLKNKIQQISNYNLSDCENHEM